MLQCILILFMYNVTPIISLDIFTVLELTLNVIQAPSMNSKIRKTYVKNYDYYESIHISVVEGLIYFIMKIIIIELKHLETIVSYVVCRIQIIVLSINIYLYNSPHPRRYLSLLLFLLSISIPSCGDYIYALIFILQNSQMNPQDQF